MFTFILLISLILFLFYKYVGYRQSYWKRQNVASPEPVFLMGNFNENFFQTTNLVEIYDRLYRKYRDSNRVLGVYSLLTPQLLVLDATIAKEIFVKNFSNFHDTSFATLINTEADPLLSRNPFFLSGQEWKEKRAEITPAFSPARIKAMFPLIEDVCKRIVTYIEGKQEIALEGRDLCSRFTVDVVSNCIFGADAESFIHEAPQIQTMARKLFGNDFTVQLRFMLAFVMPSVAKFFRVGFIPKYVQDFFRDLMSQAVEQRQKMGISRQDYLEYLLQMQGKKKTSNLELAANAITFFTDGFDTSSVAIASTLYELAVNKEIQNRLRKELNGVSGYDGFMEHEYLDFVFTEALRMHPPGGFTVRECTSTFELDVLDKDKKLKLKKGDALYFPIWSFHRDERYYEEPNTFNPDRFANGALKKYIDEGLYLTFGMGPRTCIGQKFARTQSKTCIATIVKNFEIELDSKTQLPLQLDPKEFLTYFTGGVWLKFKKLSI